MALVGLVFRAVVTWVAHGKQATLLGDSTAYLIAADGLRDLVLSGGSKADFRLMGSLVRGPVYPIFVALFGGGTDRTLVPLLAAQVVLGGATCLAVFWLGVRLAGPGVGLVACGVVALLPDMVQASAVVMTEPVRTALVAAALLAVDQARRRPHLVTGLGAGLCVALLALSHSSTLALVAPFALWAWLWSRPRRWWLLPALAGPWLALAVGGLLAAEKVAGGPVLPGAGGQGWGGGGAWAAFMGARTETMGLILASDYDYVNPDAYPRLRERLATSDTNVFVAPVEPELRAAIAGARLGKPLPDAVFARAWLERLIGDPIGFARLAFLKAERLVISPGLFLADRLPLAGELHNLVNWLALLGFVSPRSPLWRSARLLLAIVPTYLLGVYALILPEPRYWAPAEPALAVLAAAGGWAVARAARSHVRRFGTGLLIAFVGLGLIVQAGSGEWPGTPSGVVAEGAASILGWVLVAVATALLGAVRSRRGVALVVAAVLPALLLQLTELSQQELLLDLNADRPALIQRWTGVPALHSRGAQLLISVPSGPSSIEVFVNGEHALPDSAPKLPNNWVAYQVPLALTDPGECSVMLRAVGDPAQVGTMVRDASRGEVWAASLARHYDGEVGWLSTRFNPMRERYAVAGRAVSSVLTADGTLAPAELHPLIFLLVSTESGQVLL